MTSKVNVYVGLDTNGSQNLGCQLVSHQIRSILKDYPDIGEVYYDSAFDSGLSLVDIEKLKQSDVVYVNAEGTCNGPMDKKVQSILDNSFKYNKPVYFCNFTFDPRRQFTNRANKKDVEKWLKYFSLCKTITVREPISYYFLKERGLDEVFLLPDVGASYSQEKIDKEKQIMISVGSITKMIGSSKSNKEKYLSPLQKIIDDLSQEYKIVIHDWPSNPQSDAQFLKSMKNVSIIHGDFKSYYTECLKSVLNVTGRHHGSIMSYSAGCPFLTFKSNMWKTEGDNFFYNSAPFLEISDLKNGNHKWIDTIRDEIRKIDLRVQHLEDRKSVLQPYHASGVEILWKQVQQPDISFIDFDSIKEWLKVNYTLV